MNLLLKIKFFVWEFPEQKLTGLDDDDILFAQIEMFLPIVIDPFVLIYSCNWQLFELLINLFVTFGVMG